MSRADNIGIVVQYVETDDLPDGRPVLPGYPGDGITWAEQTGARSGAAFAPQSKPINLSSPTRRAASRDQT
jgi:hypothetical protein